MLPISRERREHDTFTTCCGYLSLFSSIRQWLRGKRNRRLFLSFIMENTIAFSLPLDIPWYLYLPSLCLLLSYFLFKLTALPIYLLAFYAIHTCIRWCNSSTFPTVLICTPSIHLFLFEKKKNIDENTPSSFQCLHNEIWQGSIANQLMNFIQSTFYYILRRSRFAYKVIVGISRI